MRIAVTGSIATDHLMTFASKFTDTLIADKLDKISVSFLVGDLQIRRGGVAGNIAFGLGCLRRNPLLVGSVGPDFAEFVQDAKKAGKTVDDVVSTWQTPAKYAGYADVQEARLRSNAQVIFDEIK